MTAASLLLALAAVSRAGPEALPLEQAQMAARQLVSEVAPPLANLREVEPGFYRLAQPTRDGVRQLKQNYRVRAIVNLRLGVPAYEREEAALQGVALRNVRMNGMFLPRFSEVDAALSVLTDPALRPVALHCRRGRDRTGVVVAAYRVVVGGWAPADAAREARGIGCCPPTFLVPLERYLALYKRHAQRALGGGDDARLDGTDDLAGRAGVPAERSRTKI